MPHFEERDSHLAPPGPSFASVLTNSPDSRSNSDATSSFRLWWPEHPDREFFTHQSLFPPLPSPPVAMPGELEPGLGGWVASTPAEAAATTLSPPFGMSTGDEPTIVAPSGPRRRAEVVILSPSPEASETTGDGPDAGPPGDMSAGGGGSGFSGSSRTRPYSPPPVLPPTPPPASSPRRRSSIASARTRARDPTAGEDDEDDESGTLFLTSYRNGLRARQRRRGGMISRPDPVPFAELSSDSDSMEDVETLQLERADRQFSDNWADRPGLMGWDEPVPRDIVDPNAEESLNRAHHTVGEPEDEFEYRQSIRRSLRTSSRVNEQRIPEAAAQDLRQRVMDSARELAALRSRAESPGSTGLSALVDETRLDLAHHSRRLSELEAANRAAAEALEASTETLGVTVRSSTTSQHGSERDLGSKPVLALYCGTPSRQPIPLPRGFKYAPSPPGSSSEQDSSGVSASASTASAQTSGEFGGCGALLCIRAASPPFTEVAYGGGRRRMMFSSDAPPVDGALGLVAEENRVGFKEAGTDCGCEREEIGCLQCGLIVGYRSSDDCTRCSLRAYPRHRLLFSAQRVTVRPRRGDQMPAASIALTKPLPAALLISSNSGPSCYLFDPLAPEESSAVMRWANVPSLASDLRLGILADPKVWLPAPRSIPLHLRRHRRDASASTAAGGHGAIGDSRRALLRLGGPSVSIANLFAARDAPPPAVLEEGAEESSSSSPTIGTGWAAGLTRRPSIRVRDSPAARRAAVHSEGSAGGGAQFPTSHARATFERPRASSVSTARDALDPAEDEEEPGPRPPRLWDGAERRRTAFGSSGAGVELPPLPPGDPPARGYEPFGYGSLYDYALETFRNGMGARAISSSGGSGESRSRRRDEGRRDGLGEEQDEDEIWKECWPRQRRRVGEGDDQASPGPRGGGSRGGGESIRRFRWTGEVCAR